MKYLLKPSQLEIFSKLVKRQMLLNLRNSSALFGSLMFYLITIVIFHIGIGPSKLSFEIGNGIIFCSLYFTLMLSSDRLLQEDYRSGVVEELIVSGVKEFTILASYLFSYSFTFSIAFLILLPTGHFMFDLPLAALPYNIVVSVLCIVNTSIILLFIRVLTLNLRTSTLLVILAAPFLIPNLILTVLSVNSLDYALLSIGWLLVMLPITFIFARLMLREAL